MKIIITSTILFCCFSLAGQSVKKASRILDKITSEQALKDYQAKHPKIKVEWVRLDSTHLFYAVLRQVQPGHLHSFGRSDKTSEWYKRVEFAIPEEKKRENERYFIKLITN